MASESALAKREAHLARREASHKARLRAEHYETALEKAHADRKGLLRRAADEPFVDSIAELGGTLGEAAIKHELPSVHPFTAAAGLAVELLALIGYRKSPARTEYRTVASIARGMQARARVEVADATIAAIFA
jgi:hypothetical protein